MAFSSDCELKGKNPVVIKVGRLGISQIKAVPEEGDFEAGSGSPPGSSAPRSAAAV